MRTFASGATRGDDADKLDYEGFLSPLALKRYAEHLHQHRIQEDGNLRASDNWQNGIPLDAYMKSAWRHFMELWTWHRTPCAIDLGLPGPEESLCALLFNLMGYLHEYLKFKQAADAYHHNNTKSLTP